MLRQATRWPMFFMAGQLRLSNWSGRRDGPRNGASSPWGKVLLWTAGSRL